MFKICFHKWIEIDKQSKYEYFQCSKCENIKIKELFEGGYQPKKLIIGGNSHGITKNFYGSIGR